ncbi:putative apolipoprotein A-I binding protein [Toxoplasma gondii RUB]|uniref:NAD(P)H-hydrate epimerase n=1 Tax=Toxoplasma gondii RUB TaxID=935652 RepID=A0A086M5U1_TOXGO|nr:putative apolipoprotein A-I binding protein [Toxoplasma gondii RUB]
MQKRVIHSPSWLLPAALPFGWPLGLWSPSSRSALSLRQAVPGRERRCRHPSLSVSSNDSRRDSILLASPSSYFSPSLSPYLPCASSLCPAECRWSSAHPPPRSLSTMAQTPCNLTYLTQSQAQALDEDLMGSEVGYSVDQLMELAGLSVAQAVAEAIPLSPAVTRLLRVLVVAGPGNNGGDGLVAARHLKLFGYQVHVWCPRPPAKALFENLMKQLRNHRVPVTVEAPPDLRDFHLIVDSIFGFSFKGFVRPPFDAVLHALKTSNIPVLSVDIPSGWDVEKGNVTGEGLEPQYLISLTAPKLCAKHFKKVHFVGGRFVPESMVEKYQLVLPEYPGIQGVVRID